MQFTREPIIETIITPKEGYKLVVRSSKTSAQEEFTVDSVQLIMIGQNCFYRSLEKPKAFLVPASDYEILEVRETRVQLKIPGKDVGGIKVAGGRETSLKSQKEPREKEASAPKETAEEEAGAPQEGVPERHEKGRRRRFRKRHKDEGEAAPSETTSLETPALPPPAAIRTQGDKPLEERFIIPPPATLISESIGRYRDLPDFKGAFFEKEEQEGEQPPQEELVKQEELPEEGRDFLNS